VLHAVFYNFADGEVAHHIPWVWGKTTPEEAIAVRERGSAAALRQMIGELADSPALVRVADLATRAAVSAPTSAASPAPDDSTCSIRTLGQLSATPEPPPRPL
jgi:hypothetical protein